MELSERFEKFMIDVISPGVDAEILMVSDSQLVGLEQIDPVEMNNEGKEKKKKI